MGLMKCSRTWIVAGSMGAVEALKDQGFCRWNHAIRSIHHNARNSLIVSCSQAKDKLLSAAAHDQESSAAAAMMLSNGRRPQECEEDSLRKVMYLSCWGPN